MAKVVKLTVHKNTLEKRKVRQLARHADFRKLMRDSHCTSFAFVAFDKVGRAHVNYHVDSKIPTWVFPDSVAWAIKGKCGWRATA